MPRLDQRPRVDVRQLVGLAPVPDPAGSPFRLIPISPNTQSGQWFDFMSYCDHVGDGQPFDTNQNAWVSVHNWNAVLANFGYGPAHDTGGSVPTGHPSAAAVPSLQIRATVSPGGQVTIVGVDPVTAPPQPAAASTYQLTGTDASGGRLVQVPMHATFGHSDSRPAQPILMLEGVVPAANLAGIGVLSNTVVRDDSERSGGALLLTPALTGTLTQCCANGTFSGLQLDHARLHDVLPVLHPQARHHGARRLGRRQP